MYKIAICEDNQEQRKYLKNVIDKFKSPYLLEVDIFSSGESLIEAYKNEGEYSIILLDMQLDKINGIETAEIIRRLDKKVIIIIVTSIIEYAVEGYNIDAFDFILKPIDEKRLKLIIKKAIRKLKEANDKIYKISQRDKIQLIRLSEIIYIESYKKKVELHCLNDCIVSENKGLSEIECKLKHDGFIRISRFYLINLAYIKEVDNNFVKLTNGECLKYSSKNQRIIKESYMNYMMEDL